MAKSRNLDLKNALVKHMIQHGRRWGRFGGGAPPPTTGKFDIFEYPQMPFGAIKSASGIRKEN